MEIEVMELLENGYTYKQIAYTTGLPYAMVANIVYSQLPHMSARRLSDMRNARLRRARVAGIPYWLIVGLFGLSRRQAVRIVRGK
jgi:DNA-binding NarL/FixJ family response regulator